MPIVSHKPTWGRRRVAVAWGPLPSRAAATKPKLSSYPKARPTRSWVLACQAGQRRRKKRRERPAIQLDSTCLGSALSFAGGHCRCHASSPCSRPGRGSTPRAARRRLRPRACGQGRQVVVLGLCAPLHREARPPFSRSGPRDAQFDGIRRGRCLALPAVVRHPPGLLLWRHQIARSPRPIRRANQHESPRPAPAFLHLGPAWVNTSSAPAPEASSGRQPDPRRWRHPSLALRLDAAVSNRGHRSLIGASAQRSGFCRQTRGASRLGKPGRPAPVPRPIHTAAGNHRPARRQNSRPGGRFKANRGAVGQLPGGKPRSPAKGMRMTAGQLHTAGAAKAARRGRGTEPWLPGSANRSPINRRNAAASAEPPTTIEQRHHTPPILSWK